MELGRSAANALQSCVVFQGDTAANQSDKDSIAPDCSAQPKDERLIALNEDSLLQHPTILKPTTKAEKAGVT